MRRFVSRKAENRKKIKLADFSSPFQPVEVLVYAAALDSGPDTAADTDDAESGPTAVVNRRRAAAASRFSACLQTFLFLFGLSAIVVGFIGAHRIVSHVRRYNL